MKWTTITLAGCLLILIFSRAHAGDPNWPVVKPGEPIEIADLSSVPLAARKLITQTCQSSEPMDSGLTFFEIDDNHYFVIAHCSFGIGSSARLFRIEKDQATEIALPFGDLTHGFGISSLFSWIAPTKRAGTLSSNFATDACGEDGYQSFEYEFHLTPNDPQIESFELVGSTSYDCDWKHPKPLWLRGDKK